MIHLMTHIMTNIMTNIMINVMTAWKKVHSHSGQLSKNMRSSVGMMTFPISGKIKFMFQTTDQDIW